MTGLRRLLVATLGAASLVAFGASSAAADEGNILISFHTMTPVTGADVGTVNDRGIRGGGLPWRITSGTGTVDHQGHVSVMVTGLVLAAGANEGKNPITQFKATLSCITPHGIVNVSTGLFAASLAGDSTIVDTVALPHPCMQPIVFVGAPSGAWFAMSNADQRDEDEDGD
jgi:hypothetical protein